MPLPVRETLVILDGKGQKYHFQLGQLFIPLLVQVSMWKNISLLIILLLSSLANFLVLKFF